MKTKKTAHTIATPVQRFIAALIDLAILAVIYLLLSRLLPHDIVTYSLYPLDIITKTAPSILPAEFTFVRHYLALNVLFMLINYPYSVILTATRGQTIGKMIVKIKVVDEEKYRLIGYNRALIRETMGKFISGVPLDLGYLWLFFDTRKRTWHDLIAKTIVVTA